MKKLLVSVLLSIILIFSTVAYGQIDVNIHVDSSDITLDFQSNYMEQPASIKIYDDHRIYYMNQYLTDVQGKFQVTLELPEDNLFNGKVNIKGETKTFIMDTSGEGNTNPNPVQKFVDIVVKGHESTLLSRKTIEIEEGDSVFDVLRRACNENNVNLKYQSNGYVESIGGLSEGDEGPLSGWKYDVNGNNPNIASSNYELRGGEYILWYFVKTPSNTSSNPGFNENNKLGETLDKADVILESGNSTEKELENIFNELLAVEDISSSDAKFGQYMNSIHGIAKSRVEKAGTVVITGNVSIVDGKDRVEAEVTLKEMSDAITKAKNMASSIKNELRKKDISLDTHLDTKITLTIDREGKKDVSLSFPGEMTKELVENNIEEVTIDTGIAHINLPITELKNIENKIGASHQLTMGIAELNKEDLPESMKDQVPDDSLVYDFNLLHEGTKISHFNNPIEIRIPFNGDVESGNSVTVFYINDNNELEIIGGKYDPKSQTVKFITNHFSSFFAKEYSVTFEDIKDINWAKEHIEKMASQGIVRGELDNNFYPNEYVSRPEVATMILRMMKYSKLNDNAMSFEDVVKEAWYYDNVHVIYQNGIMTGKSNQEFGIGKLTRQELAKILGDILVREGNPTLTDTKSLERFTDYFSIGSWAKEQVDLAVQAGIITGFEDNSFRPEDNVTRAECAVMLSRLYDVVKK